MSAIEVGFTLQPEDAFLDRITPLLRDVDYAEIAPETTWFVDGTTRRENGFHRRFRALGESFGLGFVAHGVGYSLGDPGGEDRRRRWREWVAADHRQFDFRWYSDHLWATSIGDRALTLPVPLPMTATIAERVRARLAEMAEVVPVAGVETTVTYFALGDPMDEPAWLNEVLRASGHRLVLDLHNVFTTTRNAGTDADAWIARLDLDAVIELHVSGGASSDPRWLSSGRVMRLDAHADAVPEEVFALLDRWAPRCPRLRGITLERMEGTVTSDAHVAELEAELARVRALAEALPSLRTAHVRAVAEAVESVVDEVRAFEALAGFANVADPVAHLRDAGLSPSDDDGVRIAALLATRLRFERLLRGSGQVERWFEEDAEDFTEAFRAYHAAVPATAFFPPDEARCFDQWLRGAR